MTKRSLLIKIVSVTHDDGKVDLEFFQEGGLFERKQYPSGSAAIAGLVDELIGFISGMLKAHFDRHTRGMS